MPAFAGTDILKALVAIYALRDEPRNIYAWRKVMVDLANAANKARRVCETNSAANKRPHDRTMLRSIFKEAVNACPDVPTRQVFFRTLNFNLETWEDVSNIPRACYCLPGYAHIRADVQGAARGQVSPRATERAVRRRL